MADKLSFHCAPEGEGDFTDARPSISDSESDVDQDPADANLSGSVGSREGKATHREGANYDQDSDGKPYSQTNGFTVRPADERYDRNTSSPWKELDISVVISILTPLLSWAFGREYMKNVLVAILLVYYLHQLIEGSCAREMCLTLLTLG